MSVKMKLTDGPQDLGCLSGVKKIRIERCRHAGRWYAARVGTVIEVEKTEVLRHPYHGIPEDVYWVRTGDAWNTINYVLKSDATEV